MVINSNDDFLILPVGKRHQALISVEDADLCDWSWCAKHSHNQIYAFHVLSVINHRIIERVDLHRLVLGRILQRPLADSEVPDHIDLNGLNNRRSNLRLATPLQNAANRGMLVTNTSGYKGVSWSKADKKWRATIGYRGKKLSLGLFDDPADAHRSYCKAASELHGDFARFE